MEKTVFAFAVVLLWIGLAGSGWAEEASVGTDEEIQAKLDALDGTGGVVQLEAKTYVIRKMVGIPSDVTLAGAGMGKTILRLADGVNDSVVRNKRFIREQELGEHNLGVRDLTIDGNAEGNPEGNFGGGVWFMYCYDYRIENVEVRNSRGMAAIYTAPDHRSKGQVRKNYIVGCVVEDTKLNNENMYGHGIYVTAPDNDNVLVKNCVARRNEGTGINLEDAIQYCFVEDCESYENKMYGVWLASVNHCVVKGNKIHHNLRGIQMDYRSTHNIIIGNEIHENGLEGMFLATYGFKELKPKAYCVVAGNVVKNNNQYFLDAGAGIHVELEEIVFYGNFCYDDQPIGQKTQMYGMVVFAPNNLIVNNYLDGNIKSRSQFVPTVGIWMEEGNTLVQWDYSKPWTPENLVSEY